MKLTDYIVRFFEQKGAEHVFMLSGGGCMHLIDSFGKSKQIEYICCHHEQSVAMASEAYGRMSGKFGLAVVTCGPGATNTTTGVLGAWQDSSPCIFISGQAKRKNTIANSGLDGLRQFGQQEVNIVPIVKSITKYAVMINDPKEVRYHLEKALYLATTGRPGPVWIDVPLDVQNSQINENELKGFTPENNVSVPSNTDIEDVCHALCSAKRPVIIAGQGVRIANACNELRTLVDAYHIPIVHSFLGIDTLPSNHPCDIGRIGVKGTRAGNFTIQNADLVLALGSRLSVSSIGFEGQLFAREAKKIVIDIDETEHKKNVVTIDKFILSDVRIFLKDLIYALKDTAIAPFTNWLEKTQHWKQSFPTCLPQYNDDKEGINYYKLIELINLHSSNQMPIVSDAGSAFYVTSQMVELKQGQRYIPSGALATMGYTLPATIGVAAANHGKPVIGITGDGSFMQNIQEVIVLKAHQLPVKLFVVNNQGYLSIRQSQRKFFKGHLVAEGPTSGVIFPNFQKIAEACGVAYRHIETIAEAEEQLPKIMGDLTPMIIEVKSLPLQEVIPTTSSAMRTDGTMFSKPMEDMYPFMDRELFEKEMVISPIAE